jgi:exodeoxyribonuclease V alpha subunit
MITGEVKKILTQKDNDWGRYELDCMGKDVLAVGVIPNVTIGMIVTIEGNEENNKYGKQFKISDIINTEADKNAGARRFLSDGYIKGIGPTKANAIIAKYGSESVEMFETAAGRANLASVKGLGKSTIDKAMPSYEQNKKYKGIIMFLNGIGTKNQVERIYEKYGNTAVSVLKQNPYRLQMDLDGFGFLRADSLAMACGIKPDSIYRVTAAIKYIIEDSQMMGGHCYLTMDEIRERIAPLLVPMPKFTDITEKVAENAAAEWPDSKEKLIKTYDPCAETLIKLSQTVESRDIINGVLTDALAQAIEDGDFVNDDGRIYTKKMYELECDTAKIIAEMCKENPVRFVSPKIIESVIENVEKRKTKAAAENGSNGEFKVTKEQRDAVYLALMHRISIISGGPGRGKTAISEIVARGFLEAGKQYDKEDILMLAPTGRAAQRITESTGYDAMTAHRAILALKRGEDRPIGKLVLVDESSMVDIYLMHNILDYARDCNLIFVGDVDQIASVGPGKVLRDMINSGKVPCILLKEGHRNSGTIARNSEMINAGFKIDRYVYDEHFTYIPATADNIADLLVNDYITKVNQYGITNVMLCSAMRERGCVSVKKLNERLQEIYTKGHTEAKFSDSRIFRVGDRVMQTKNDYSFILMHDGKPRYGVFNGEKGTVARITYDAEDEDYKVVVVFDDGSIGGYTRNTIGNLVLAYATTLHKCQGSEAACMMMAYTFGDYMLLNRSLFYTGETRAKKEFRFYGEEKWKYGKMLSAFDIAVSKTEDAERNTALAERIANEL